MNINPRIVVASLSLSAMGLVGIVMRESYTDVAVIPTKGDVPTIGFGSTDGVKLGDKTTPPRALARAASELDTVYEAAVKRCVKAPLHQAEYDVMVDFAYQYGGGALCGSGVVRSANTGDYMGSCEAYAEFRFMTSVTPIQGWEPYKFDSAGHAIRWRFDCSTPGNRVCRGVWIRQASRIEKCKAAQ